MEGPDTLAQRIALFRRECACLSADSEELFRIRFWVQVMLGQRLEPHGHHRFGRLLGKDKLRDALANIRANVANTVAAMPSQQEFLDRYCPSVLKV